MELLAKSSVWYTIVSGIPVHFYLFWNYWPKQYFILHGIPAYLSFFMWLWYILPHVFGSIAIFHQLCYYLELRFIFIYNSLKKFSLSNSVSDRSKELIQILNKHNQICETVHKFNDFWRFEMLLNAMLYSIMVLMLTYISFFTPLLLWLKIFFGSFSIFLIVCFCCVFFSAASVANQVFIQQNLINWNRKNINFYLSKGSQMLSVVKHNKYKIIKYSFKKKITIKSIHSKTRRKNYWILLLENHFYRQKTNS